jgi:hypothetical protein
MVFTVSSTAQQPDSLSHPNEPVVVTPEKPHIETYDAVMASLLSENILLAKMGSPVSFAETKTNRKSNDSMFYLMTGLVMLLAVLRYSYDRYFNNLFRVFFNTSLRQSQLTDQLLQAKLPSLLFNFFFMLSGGLYSYLLLLNLHWLNRVDHWIAMACCVLLIGTIYFMKFCILKFSGWITGYREQTNSYIFVLFLINKIMGIFLVPFVVVMAFSEQPVLQYTLILSLLVIGSMFLLRFFRSYGLLQNQLKISRFHFMLFVTGIELLPLLLLYKGLLIFLNKIL